MKPQFLILDTKDDRREIYHLLGKLPPVDRVRYLEWCCRQVRKPGQRLQPTPSRRMTDRVQQAQRFGVGDDRLTTEIYFDWWRLANTYGLDVTAAAIELERLVKAKARAKV